MENIRDFINDKNVIKDEIYLAFENSVLCPICTDVFNRANYVYELSKCLL